MSRLQLRLLSNALPLFLLFSTILSAQDSSRIVDSSMEAGISLNCRVDRTETPLNRTVELVVSLQWSGDLQRYDILAFDNPILQNFDILGSGSSNKVSSVGGVATAIREYTFTLKPQTIGMGYIEPIIIKYTDTATDADFTLTSNRIPVKVNDPVSEGETLVWLLRLAAALIIVLLAFFVFRLLRRKKIQREKLAQEAVIDDVSIEDEYLQELAALVNLNDPPKDGAKALSQMTRLLRRYLHEKFAAPGFEATTGELFQFLYAQKFDDHFINEMKELLSAADIVKFSGSAVSRADVEKSYGVIESTLLRGSRDEILYGEQAPTQNDEN